MSHTSLPIDQAIPELKQALNDHANVVLVAAPGAGKTTRVPLALLTEPWLQQQKILMLEPRRIATRNAARFMAKQLSEETGHTVGYRMRMESRTSASTRIEVITEGLLTRMLQNDPELSGVGLIIFDEFHERNQHSDLGLALARNSQQLFRQDLKILIMSATLDEDTLAHQLEAPIVRSEGRSFDITTHYRPASEPLNSHRNALIRHCCNVVREAMHHGGDMLVFLPGAAEINALQQALQDLDAQLVPLHGQLSDQQQKLALQPQSPHDKQQKKIILATNIAESSVTIDGVRTVIDSGLERRQQFDVRSGIERLATRNISQASATQRQGRAGRQAVGVCYRLWAESQHQTRAKHIAADIEHSDLSSLLLALRQWGAEAEELTWLSPPNAAALSRARLLLQQLNILSVDSNLTAHGHRIAESGLEPRWAHSLICADQQGYGRSTAELVALLQLSPHKPKRSDDIESLMQQSASQLTRQAAKLARNWIDTLQLKEDHSPVNPGRVIALAFPDRIARLRSSSDSQQASYQLSSGAGVVLQPDSALGNHEWLAIADIGGQQATVRLAYKLVAEDIGHLLEQHTYLGDEQIVIDWQSNGQLLAEQRQMLGKLTWQKQALPALKPSQWDDAWSGYFRSHGLDSLPWNDNCLALRQRMHLAFQSDTHGNWPEVTDDALVADLEQWLLPFLQQTRHQKDLKKVDLYNALLSLLDWQQQQRLDKLLPTHIKVASGSKVRINYGENPPVLAVKLQEMFGFDGQPAILNDRLPLMIHLLSPAQRPLAVTQDLSSFWRNGYPEVRKDMRGRYPKHPWPDDPLEAQATRFTKKHQ